MNTEYVYKQPLEPAFELVDGKCVPSFVYVREDQEKPRPALPHGNGRGRPRKSEAEKREVKSARQRERRAEKRSGVTR